jgi:hypothetical protein
MANEVEVIETLPVKLANRCLVDGQVREKDEVVYIDKAIAECFGKIVKDSPADKSSIEKQQ